MTGRQASLLLLMLPLKLRAQSLRLCIMPGLQIRLPLLALLSRTQPLPQLTHCGSMGRISIPLGLFTRCNLRLRSLQLLLQLL